LFLGGAGCPPATSSRISLEIDVFYLGRAGEKRWVFLFVVYPVFAKCNFIFELFDILRNGKFLESLATRPRPFGEMMGHKRPGPGIGRGLKAQLLYKLFNAARP
jgi:hypothetical protein